VVRKEFQEPLCFSGCGEEEMLAIKARFDGKTIMLPKELEQIPPGDYGVEVFFVDNARRVWASKSGRLDARTPLLSAPVPLGELKVAPRNSLPSGR
jgi:hypothetical protein